MTILIAMRERAAGLAAAGGQPCDNGESRIEARGKFLYRDDQKLYVRGVTYGPFRPDARGCEYHTPDVVA